MKISLMNVRIFITKNEVVTDSIGNHRNTWKPYYTCYATISAESPSEMTPAGVVIDSSKAEFTIRWCRKAAAIDSTHFRVQQEGDLYDVVGVDHMNNKRKAIKLKCMKVER